MFRAKNEIKLTLIINIGIYYVDTVPVAQCMNLNWPPCWRGLHTIGASNFSLRRDPVLKCSNASLIFECERAPPAYPWRSSVVRWGYGKQGHRCHSQGGNSYQVLTRDRCCHSQGGEGVVAWYRHGPLLSLVPFPWGSSSPDASTWSLLTCPWWK